MVPTPVCPNAWSRHATTCSFNRMLPNPRPSIQRHPDPDAIASRGPHSASSRIFLSPPRPGNLAELFANLLTSAAQLVLPVVRFFFRPRQPASQAISRNLQVAPPLSLSIVPPKDSLARETKTQTSIGYFPRSHVTLIRKPQRSSGTRRIAASPSTPRPNSLRTSNDHLLVS